MDSESSRRSERTHVQLQMGGTTETSKSFAAMFVSAEDPRQYCYAKYTRKGNTKTAEETFTKQKEKFSKGKAWRMQKVAVAKDKPLYNAAPVKVVVDINFTTFTPVLQSTTLTSLEPEPSEALGCLLEANSGQRVDLMAVVTTLSVTRIGQTSTGPRIIVDVTVRDDSGTATITGAEEHGAISPVVECDFTLFFNDNVTGRTEEQKLRANINKPVCFFNMCIYDKEEGKHGLRPDRRTHVC